MNAEIIAVGSELLLGQITNTNAKFLSQQLAEIGINVYYHTVVGDNKERLIHAIREAESRADLLIFTGGLGPTKDDLTKETISTHIGRPLVYDQAALESIENYFAKTRITMTPNNRKQALVMEKSVVLPNDYGMAPGMLVKKNKHAYILLPGPPREMQPMFTSYARPELLNILEKVEKIESRVLRFFGIGESTLETELEDLLIAQQNPTLAPLAGDGEVTLRITAKHESEAAALQMIQQAEEEVLRRVGEYFYGYNDTTLARELAVHLKKHNSSIAAAESLTGGLFQSELTDVPGASSFFSGGIVCYSNEAKKELVKVKEETLARYGAVSAECAAELAENVRRLLGAEFGISFTGAAGPEPLEGHPPGTVWIGLSRKGKETETFKLSLSGSRAGVRKRAVKYGCHYLLAELSQKT
ncbi:competence/damage-inducible protein A [Bacillus thermotolerans]|uniref:Putative competence-damage inducible protein n=1 Tax=Bacillus thermotolerans TaxID=1221996 RepID=A0A0F5I044_BACTR|nr:competence/damage-inducible protein A [Bacillus thermotolerans]KKB38908.1 Molybdopterin binding motif protein [Bacillus thermotolerans]KKB42425.1 Molybdopterin binding motif protein [Bacillus thermotolerans]KKB44735.1 Molybdopterin binding motif protein [Bacillus thermotolerans]